MDEFRADLHCHSTCSDGTLTPEEIVEKAASIGLSGLSITDHDTIEAYQQAIPKAKQLGIELIPGVEFSAVHEGVSVHILAYAFSTDNPTIKNFCQRHYQRRINRNREILKLLTKHGMPLSEEELQEMVPMHAKGTLGRPHIALAMVTKGYIQSIQDAFNKHLGEGKNCYAPGEPFSVEETLKIIHEAGGLAVIAHPHLIDHPATLKKLLEMDFDGIECYYARFPKDSHARWLKIAQHRKWLITGGSDFHGSIKPNIPLGASWVNEEAFRLLQNHRPQYSQPSEYDKLLKKLFSINLHGGMKLGLNNIEQLNAAMGHPMKAFKSIHVAGTNGKGSVVTKMAKALEEEGYRVGLFTSPHISTFRERIRINGQLIDEESTSKHLQAIFELIDRQKIAATFFEITTALAFAYFAEQKVDFAVLEAGLGGRLDATNIVTPEISVITSISYEHTEYLGHTLEEITLEKAGIIKPNIPIVIGPCVPFQVVEPIAIKKKSLLFQVMGHFINFNDENNAIAKKALEVMGLSNESISKGLKVLPPCRIEVISENPITILDVAHNPDGLEHLFQTLSQRYPNKTTRVVFGLSKNKDIEGCLNVLKHYGSQFHLVEAPNGRGIPVPDLNQKMLERDFSKDSIFIDESISKTILKAKEEAKTQKQIFVICGSFFIMNEARTALGIREPRDDIDMNEMFR